jgi:hypothetical protein
LRRLKRLDGRIRRLFKEGERFQRDTQKMGGAIPRPLEIAPAVPTGNSHNARDVFKVFLTVFCPLATVEHKIKGPRIRRGDP